MNARPGRNPKRKDMPVSLGPTELLVILLIVMLLFGASRLPKLARSLGESSKEFKKGLAEGARDEDGDAKH
jgi:sec-independent protein translocase protein TatA